MNSNFIVTHRNLGIFLFLIFLNCGHQSAKHIDVSTAFKVGSISVTRYEMKKNLSFLINNYTDNFSTSPPADSIRLWKNELINKYYFAADAYDKGYFDNFMIESMVNEFARFMLTQRRGLVEERLIEEEVTMDESTLPAIYQKRDSLYFFDIIKFADINQLKNYLGDTERIMQIEHFSLLLNKVQTNPDVFSESINGCRYPFLRVWDICDTIYNMQAGQISNFIISQTGIYIIYLKKKEFALKESYEQFKENFPGYYRMTKGEWLLDKYEENILKNSKFQINQDNFDLLYNRITKLNNKSHITPNSIQDILKEPILNYEIDSRNVEKVISDFLNFYKGQAIKNSLDNEKLLRECIKKMVLEDYLLLQAERIGLTKEDKFILDRKNYKNNLVLQYYEQNEFKLTPISEEDLIYEYQKRKNEFRDPTGGIYVVMKFNKEESANKAYIQLKAQRNLEKSIHQLKSLKFEGLLNPELDETFDGLPFELTKETIRYSLMSNWDIVGPEKIGDLYEIFYRIKDPEIKYRPVEEVYDYLQHAIRKRKISEAKAKLLPELKKRYKLTIVNVDIK